MMPLLLNIFLLTLTGEDANTREMDSPPRQTTEFSGDDVVNDVEWVVTSQYVVHQGNRDARFEIIVEYVQQSGE